MKKQYGWLAMGAIGLATIAMGVQAQAPRNPNRFMLGPRFAFGIEADFAASGSPAVNPGPPTGGAVERRYDDGFVGVDSNGNADGRTWYWGYSNPGQVDLAADSLTMTAFQGVSNPAVKGVDSDPQVGVEAVYHRLLGEFGGAYWGLDFGGSWMPVSLDSKTSFGSSVTRTRDVYSLGGVLPPGAPYTGSITGPGPTIGSEPVRSQFVEQVTVSSSRELDATVYGIHLGPLLEVPMGDPLALRLSAGALLVYADAEYATTERVSYPDAAGTVVRSSGTNQDWILGGYIRGQVIWQVSRRVGIFAAAEYQALSDLDVRAGNQEATLKLGDTVYGSAGLEIRF